jgi:peroxiredoxin/outer membrane lipoprotein-sorting protein
MTRFLPAAAAATLSVLLVSSAATEPSAGETATLLKSVARVYEGLVHYHIEGTLTASVDAGGTHQRLATTFELAAIRPQRLLSRFDGAMLQMYRVSNGEAVWIYHPGTNEYMREEGALVGPAAESATFGESILLVYTAYADSAAARRARIVGKETLTVGDRPVDCLVVEISANEDSSMGRTSGPDTLWVDPARSLVARSSHRIVTEAGGMVASSLLVFEYDRIDIDEAPPESLFVFHPPEGAREVESFSESASRWVGKAAPGFALRSLDGREYRLAELRGSVVLIDFWATWCAPCRRELPHIERLHRELADRGLVVVAVSAESRERVERFLDERRFTFAALLDPGRDVHSAYGVQSIPQVFVVDRDGNVAAHLVGARSEGELRAALREAGLQ